VVDTAVHRAFGLDGLDLLMKIARVFPTRTNMSPMDRDAYFGLPGLFASQRYEEIHVSVAFTWDIERANWLKKQWEMIAPVKIGGPAINGEPTNGFETGKYLKKGVTITSRGCPNRCPFCFVKQDLIELKDFPEGNIIQDNNILACSGNHLDKVFQMLSCQKQINFSGGFESSRITDQIIERLRGLSVYQVWLSYDLPDAEKPLKKAVDKLRKYFRREQLRCYVLIGFHGDTLEKAESRLRRAWEIGTLPFAMRYRTPQKTWKDSYLFEDKLWSLFTRKWTRPAIIKSRMRVA